MKDKILEILLQDASMIEEHVNSLPFPVRFRVTEAEDSLMDRHKMYTNDNDGDILYDADEI